LVTNWPPHRNLSELDRDPTIMERLLLLIGGGLTLCLLVYASLMQMEGSRQNSLDELSAVVPDDDWYKKEVLASDKPVLVEFTASWCVYCKQMAELMREIEKHYGEQIKVVEVDVDQHPEVNSAMRVQGLPTVMVVKNRKIVAYEVGKMRYETLEQIILPHLKTDSSGVTPSEAPLESPVEETPETDPQTGTGRIAPQPVVQSVT